MVYDSREKWIESKVESEQSKQSVLWMITFTDILALMLVFFIMNYAMSTVKRGKWESISKSINYSFNSTKIVEGLIDGAPLGVESINQPVASDLDYLNTILLEKITSNAFLDRNLGVVKYEDRLELLLDSGMMFEYSDDYITGNGQIALFAAGNVINQISNKIEIVITVDDYPILDKVKFKSNLELALSRAVKVGDELHKFGNNSKIDIFAHKTSDTVKIGDRNSEDFGFVKIVIKKFVGSRLE